jgi:hypothetical protein
VPVVVEGVAVLALLVVMVAPAAMVLLVHQVLLKLVMLALVLEALVVAVAAEVVAPVVMPPRLPVVLGVLAVPVDWSYFTLHKEKLDFHNILLVSHTCEELLWIQFCKCCLAGSSFCSL